MVIAAPFRSVGRPAWTASAAGLCLQGLILLSFLGCGPKMDHYQQLDQYVYNHQYDAALQLMEESREGYQQRNQALYYMEDGLLAHFAGRHSESIESLLKAESILDELYTRSISKQAASFVFNDNTIPYRDGGRRPVRDNVSPRAGRDGASSPLRRTGRTNECKTTTAAGRAVRPGGNGDDCQPYGGELRRVAR